MKQSVDPDLISRLNVIASTSSALCLVMGLSVLVGWNVNFAPLTSWGAELQMSPNSAACLVLGGISLLLLSDGSHRQEMLLPAGRKPAARALAATLCVIALLSMVERIFHLNLGIDRGLLRTVASPGRHLISMISSSTFLLLGVGLILVDWRPRNHWPSQFAAIAALLAAAFGVSALMVGPRHSSLMLPPPTIAGFVLLGAGLLCSRPEWAVAGLLARRSAGTRSLRRAVLSSLLIFATLGASISRFFLTDAHLSWVEFSLLAVFLISLLAAYVTWKALLVDRLEATRQQTEEVRKLLAAVVGSSSDAIITLAPGGNIISWNSGAEKVFGYCAEETLGKSILMLNAPEFVEADADLQDLLDRLPGNLLDDRGAVTNFDAVCVRKNGENIHVSVAVSAVRDETGSVVGNSFVARDITKRKQAEKALRDSEERFQTLANGISQLAWMAQADGVIDWYNQRWYAYTGTTFAQMRGWGWMSCHDPNVLPQVMERWTGSLSSGEPFEMEFPLLGADGQFRIFLTRVMPLKNDRGVVLRWLGTNTDISAVKQAEVLLAEQAAELGLQAEELRRSQQALEKQRSTLESVLVSIGGGLVTEDEDGKYSLWNPAQENTAIPDASGLTSAEWAAHYRAFLPGSGATVSKGPNPLLRAMQGEASSAELFVRKPEGDHGIWIESSGTPVRDKRGVVQASVVAFRDITLRKAQELEIRKLNEDLEANIAERTAQLKAANEELEAFTYSVSHDLRAPLRHIGGFSRILTEDYSAEMPADAIAHVIRIQDAVHRAGKMVDGLLSLARLGRQSLMLRLTPLNALIDEVLPFLEADYEGRNVEWRIACLPSLACDQVLVGQVFQNLLSNAIKYSRGKALAVIEIDSIQEANKPPVIFVRDNGAGFSMKYANKLFGVFQRLHTEAEFEGTGVGLATSQRIIQKHGGALWVEAEPDRGATFFFTLSATDAVALPEEVDVSVKEDY